jgi:hypothetical protein
MQRSSIRLASGLILIWGLGLAVSGCDTGVPASQAASQAKMTSDVKSAVVEPVLVESDTMVTDCDQLAKVSMAAELNAIGLQRSLPANPMSLAKNVQDLQQSVLQLQELPLQNNQVMQLRNQYVTLLQSLLPTVQSSGANNQSPSAVATTIQAAIKLRRDKIFFNSCKS